MQAGFCEVDITPRVGVGLAGFGPYLNRMSIAVRDPLKARAAALALGNRRVVVVSCDLIGLNRHLVEAGHLGGPQAALAGDQGIAAGAALDDEQWLDNAFFFNGIGELLEFLLVEIAARLMGIWRYLVDIAQKILLFLFQIIAG